MSGTKIPLLFLEVIFMTTKEAKIYVVDRLFRSLYYQRTTRTKDYIVLKRGRHMVYPETFINSYKLSRRLGL